MPNHSTSVCMYGSAKADCNCNRRYSDLFAAQRADLGEGGSSHTGVIGWSCLLHWIAKRDRKCKF